MTPIGVQQSNVATRGIHRQRKETSPSDLCKMRNFLLLQLNLATSSSHSALTQPPNRAIQLPRFASNWRTPSPTGSSNRSTTAELSPGPADLSFISFPTPLPLATIAGPSRQPTRPLSNDAMSSPKNFNRFTDRLFSSASPQPSPKLDASSRPSNPTSMANPNNRFPHSKGRPADESIVVSCQARSENGWSN